MTTAIPPFAGAGNLIYRADRVPRFVSAEGSYLTSADGRRYLDAEAANGTVAWGYDKRILHDALAHCENLPALPSFCESDLRLDVLQRLERLFREATGTPGRVELDLGGAQGMETALRIAFSAVGPGTVVVFEGAFHGRSGVTGMLSCSPATANCLRRGASRSYDCPAPTADGARTPRRWTPPVGRDASRLPPTGAPSSPEWAAPGSRGR